MLKIALYPGSFDPITYGHLDIIERSSKLFDRLVVGVLSNSAKSPLFSMEERVKMISKLTGVYGNVKVEAFEGLTVEYSKAIGASVIVRGLRAVTDFDYELQLAQINGELKPDIETIFLATSLKYSYLSSSLVKDIAYYEGDIRPFVPPLVAKSVAERLSANKMGH